MRTKSASLDSRLDEDIGAEELIKAVRRIRNKKAPGEDGITAKFIKGLPTEKWAEFRKVLNTIWEKGEMVKGWEISRIFPIFKAGGVSLLDVGYKILTSIMVRRINRWVEEGKILRESQAGFRGKRGTRDHIFVLNSSINNRIKEKGGKLYVTWDEKKILVGKGRNFHGRPFSERPFSVEAGNRALSRFYPLHLHPQMHGVRR